MRFVFRGFRVPWVRTHGDNNIPGVFVVSDNTPAILCRRVAATMKKIFSYSSDRGFAPTALINRRAAACIAVDGIFNLYKKTTDVVFEFRRGCKPTAKQHTSHITQQTLATQ